MCETSIFIPWVDGAERLFRRITFSPRSAAALQSSLTASLQKKSGSNFGPPGSSKMIFFIDDMNLPALDAYNTQSAIALIRQHIDYGHW